jgi:hypothetical protein
MAGFTVAREPPGQASYYPFNELQFQSPGDSLQGLDRGNSVGTTPCYFDTNGSKKPLARIVPAMRINLPMSAFGSTPCAYALSSLAIVCIAFHNMMRKRGIRTRCLVAKVAQDQLILDGYVPENICFFCC